MRTICAAVVVALISVAASGAAQSPAGTLIVAGDVGTPLTLSLEELKALPRTTVGSRRRRADAPLRRRSRRRDPEARRGAARPRTARQQPRHLRVGERHRRLPGAVLGG